MRGSSATTIATTIAAGASDQNSEGYSFSQQKLENKKFNSHNKVRNCHLVS